MHLKLSPSFSQIPLSVSHPDDPSSHGCADGVGAGFDAGVGIVVNIVVGADVGPGVGATVGAAEGAGVGRCLHALWPVSPSVYCSALQLAQLVLPTELAYVSTAHAAHTVTLLLPSAEYTLADALNWPTAQGTHVSGVWSTAQ